MTVRVYSVLSLFICATLSPFIHASETITLPLIRVEEDRLQDDSGGHYFLRGINQGRKSPRNLHRSWQQPEDYHNLRRWGMNALRMMMFWSALEPEPGEYNEAYLQVLDEQIDWARDAGLYVILDMHQDLWGYSIPGGNGAPQWATLDDGQAHQTLGSVWSTAYYVSPQIQHAFDNFWKNTKGPGDIGIQDRYAAAWRHVAARYADRTEVIGFDLMNEAFPGSMVQESAAALLELVPKLLDTASLPASLPEILDSIDANTMPPWLLEALDNTETYRMILDALHPMTARFETDYLMPMYERVHRAIREVNKTGIFFLEPCVLANIGVATAITALKDAEGVRDPLQAYMPHAYDIVTDTPFSHQPSEKRLQIIVQQKRLDAARLEMPLLIGEWGAYYRSDKTQDAARMMNRLLEEAQVCGAFYWEYHRALDTAVYFEVLSKAAPLRVAGILETARFNAEEGLFSCQWKNIPGTGVSVFSLPPAWQQKTLDITVSPPELKGEIKANPRWQDTPQLVVDASDSPVTASLEVRLTTPVERAVSP